MFNDFVGFTAFLLRSENICWLRTSPLSSKKTTDIISCAKGITNGVIPMGGAVVKDEIYETMLDEADNPIELFHGYTYSGHPIAAAAGLATLDIYKEEELFK